MKAFALSLCVLFVWSSFGRTQEYAQPVLNGGSAWASDFRATSQISDTFTFANTTNIRGIRVWGVYTGSPDPLPQDDFTIRFFSVSAGVPATTPYQEFTNATVITRNATGLTSGTGETIYDITFDLGFQMQFLSNETYALSVVNDTPDDLNPWRWSSSNVADLTQFNRTGDFLSTATWDVQNSGSLAFELHAQPVPEPVAILSASILGGFAFGRLRGRRLLKN